MQNNNINSFFYSLIYACAFQKYNFNGLLTNDMDIFFKHHQEFCFEIESMDS